MYAWLAVIDDKIVGLQSFRAHLMSFTILFEMIFTSFESFTISECVLYQFVNINVYCRCTSVVENLE